MTDTTTGHEIVKAELNIEITKAGLNYQALLQEGESVVFTRDNLNEKRDVLVKVRQVKKVLEEVKNPWTEKWRQHNEAKKSLVDPLDELLKRKEAEFRKVALEIEEEKRKVEVEKQRVAEIQESINRFFLDQSQAIASATTPNEIASIEKLIGSHKGNKTRYQEFLPELVEKAELLAPLIKTQKDAIKKLEQLRQQETKAEQSGDDAQLLAVRESQELIQHQISESQIRVQEKAVKMAEGNGIVTPEVVVGDAPKARRVTWEYDVVDIKETQKKMKDWVVLQIDESKVDEYLKAKRAEGITEDFTFAGVRFYQKKSY